MAIDEKRILIAKTHWPKVVEALTRVNKAITCIDGLDSSPDLEKKRSYCYYNGACASPGLKSLFMTLETGETLEIVKS